MARIAPKDDDYIVTSSGQTIVDANKLFTLSEVKEMIDSLDDIIGSSESECDYEDEDN